jgi:hypothetical protein
MSVLTHLNNTSAQLVLPTSEKASINTSISTLKTRLNDYFKADIREQLQFGSSTRGTILPRNADSQSDIDYMIVFDNSDDYKPQTFIDRLKRFASAKYSTSQIAQSHPTVILSLNHIKFDLVPAYKNWWDTIHIPAPSSSYQGWITTDPNGFNSDLSNKNQSNLYLIKPMIRLVKYWNAQNGYVYDSFLLEKSMVANTYWSCSNLKEYFFKAINDLQTYDLPQYKKDKVQRAKDIVANTKVYEADEMPFSAEIEIKKIIPIL